MAKAVKVAKVAKAAKRVEIHKRTGKAWNALLQLCHKRRHKRIGSSNNNSLDFAGYRHNNSKIRRTLYMAHIQPLRKYQLWLRNNCCGHSFQYWKPSLPFSAGCSHY